MPSGPTAIAFTALLVALSGTAVALPGKNTVDSGDIKNSTVRGKDIRNGGVGTADVKNNGLTGTDISESTLGKVPSAGSADNAANAANAGNAATVGGYQPSGIARTAFASRVSSVATDTDVTVLSATIAAPSSGFLMVTTNGVFDGVDGSLAHCGVDVDDPGDGTWASDDARSASVDFSSTPQMCSPTTRLGPVAAGSHTVRFKAHNDGTAGLSLRGGSLSVTFVPFGSSGGEGVAARRAAGGGDANR